MDEQRVSALVGEIEQAWNAHDMGRFAACFAGDADFVNVRGWWRGRGEIEQKHALFRTTIHATDTLEVPPTHPLAGDTT